MPNTSLEKAAEKALKECLGLKKRETLLIVTDKNKKRIGKTLFYTGKRLCRKAVLIEIPVGKVNGEEPPRRVAELMGKFDVIIAPTTMSVTHTMAVRNARKSRRKARVATMPGITEQILARGMSADYRKIEKRSRKINNALKKGTRIRITTRKGTDITLFRGRNSETFLDTGFVHKKGGLANLPAGESGFVPQPKKTQGTFIVDASIAGAGKVDKPVKITVKNGYAVKIEGGKAAAKLKKILKNCGKNACNIAELGIGTNDRAKISGIVLEDEKAIGTAHIALGSSRGLGGNIYAKCHLDCVFRKPTISVDGKIIIIKGHILIK